MAKRSQSGRPGEAAGKDTDALFMQTRVGKPRLVEEIVYRAVALVSVDPKQPEK